MTYRIIDFHAHAFPEKVASKAIESLEQYYEVNFNGSGMMDDVVQSAKKAGVETIVIHATATRADQVQKVNRWLATHLRENMIGFGALHPHYVGIEEEVQFILAQGLRGVKLHPDFLQVAMDDASMYKIYEQVEGRLPVLIHTGDYRTTYSSPHLLKKVLHDFPRLQVVAAHLGGWSEWEEARAFLCGLPNLYFDTSSTLAFLDHQKAMDIIRTHGVTNIFFGTDYPRVHHTEEVESFMQLPLTEEERRLILYDNAARFLGLN